MKIDMKSKNMTLINRDIEVLDKIKKYVAHKVELPNLGHYASLNDEDLWLKIVIQLCVMGGTRMIDNLGKNSQKDSEFKKEIGLNELLSIKNTGREYHIDNILTKFKATRFHLQQAKKLDKILDNSEIVQSGRIVLLDGLSHTQHFNEIRSKIMERMPYFKLASASDFMIDVGLSHDVIKLDTRVVGILNKYFDLNVDKSKVQGNKKVYISIEQTLRESCKNLNISLAQFDRMLFKFSGKDAISFIVEDL